MTQLNSGEHLISLINARTGNLNDVTVTFPQRALSVVTGASGVGKTALVIDTLHAESMRRLSFGIAAAAQGVRAGAARGNSFRFPPEFLSVSGLLPSVNLTELAERLPHAGTLGALLGIEERLYRLAAATGRPECPPGAQTRVDGKCGMRAATPEAIAEELLAAVKNGELASDATLVVCAAIVAANDELTSFDEQLEQVLLLQREGYRRFVRNDQLWRLPPLVEDDAADVDEESRAQREEFVAALREGGALSVVVDSIAADTADRERLVEALRRSLSLRSASGEVRSLRRDGTLEPPLHVVREGYHCRYCARTMSRERWERSLIGGAAFAGGEAVQRELRPSLDGEPLHTLLQRTVEETIRHLSESDDPRLKDLSLRSLQPLAALGLSRIPLDLPLRSLSSGERLKLACGLFLVLESSETLFVLDEPSTILHPADLNQLLAALHALIARGNTAIIVDREPTVCAQAAQLIILGLKNGQGEVAYEGPPTESILTSLPQTPAHTKKKRPKKASAPARVITVAHGDGTLELPLQALTAIVGRAGSGKTLFLQDVFDQYSASRKTRSKRSSAGFGQLKGVILQTEGNRPKKGLFLVDALGLGPPIAEHFALQREARRALLRASDFQLAGGTRLCPRCEGRGVIHIGLEFGGLGSERCPQCAGNRFQKEVLEVRYKGASISEVLAFNVRQALSHFAATEEIVRPLERVSALGLVQLSLGVELHTLSQSAFQRVLLCQALIKEEPEGQLLLLDQPFAGLETADLALSIQQLRVFIADGGTVFFTTHSAEAISLSDFVLELAPSTPPNFFSSPTSFQLDQNPDLVQVSAPLNGGRGPRRQRKKSN